MNWRNIHSILFVPAKRTLLKKIDTICADAFIIDLEDSVKEAGKDNARSEVSRFLREGTKANILLRINPAELETEWSLFDQFEAIKCIVIPKVETPEDILKTRNAFPDKSLMALIETPKGMVNLQSILSTNTVSAIGFGAEDYCAITKTCKTKEYLIPLQSRLVMYGNAYEVPVYDMVNSEFNDKIKYLNYVRIAKDLGFQGKMAIHPNQIDVINNEFSVTNQEELKKIIQEYERSSEGFMIMDGNIYEKPHIEQLKSLLD